MNVAPVDWHLKLFRKSVAKQAKWRRISAFLGDVSGRRGLDLGADNGVISYLLRQKGGQWCSGDLDPHAVESIRSVVADNVYQIHEHSLPFPDGHFDIVVVIDLLEHVRDDQALIGEIARVLCPGGRVIINVPHAKRWALLRPLRLALGLTDAWHGHVRPGYTLASLERLTTPGFTTEAHCTYSRFFSELLDIALNYAYVRKSRSAATQTGKGTIVTGQDIDKHAKAFRLYSRLYPLMRLFAMLDMVVRPFNGYMMIVSAVKTA